MNEKVFTKTEIILDCIVNNCIGVDIFEITEKKIKTEIIDKIVNTYILYGIPYSIIFEKYITRDDMDDKTVITITAKIKNINCQKNDDEENYEEDKENYEECPSWYPPELKAIFR